MINEISKQELSESVHLIENFFDQENDEPFEEIEHLHMEIALEDEKERDF